MNNFRKALAIVLALTSVLAFSACGKKDEPAAKETTSVEDNAAVDDTTAVAEVTTAEGEVTTADGEVTTADGEVTTAEGEVTTVEGETVAEGEVTTVEGETAETTTEASKGLNSTDIAEVVAYYNAAHAATKKAPKGKQTMKLDGEMTGGGGLISVVVKIIQGPAEKALAKNSKETDYIPGHPPILVGDVKSAKATSKNGVTTVEIKLKDQVDGPNASDKDGSVGRGVGTLGSIDTALKELGATIESGRDTVKLTYNDAYITAKINENTGTITGGTWHHKVNIFVGNAKAKLGPASATLKDFKAKIDYKVVI